MRVLWGERVSCGVWDVCVLGVKVCVLWGEERTGRRTTARHELADETTRSVHAGYRGEKVHAAPAVVRAAVWHVNRVHNCVHVHVEGGAGE